MDHWDSQLASVALSQPQCLCATLNGGGASINEKLALALPDACKYKLRLLASAMILTGLECLQLILLKV
uniref:Bifunctional inhibitor/plant lipid transfer protein/seed storage helical domain-containing protein n=1 Tax=Salix viminalis TaxID=40686 RepID=A0A6N2MWW7_SALVM